MNRLAVRIATWLGLLVTACPSLLRGEPVAEDVLFFENKIRPVLVKYCYECHAADAKEIGGKLRLDSRDGMRKGGETGTTLIAGQPDKSLIIQALRYEGLEMPPDRPLPESVVNDFVQWVRRGAPDPRVTKSTAVRSQTAQPGQAAADGHKLWSLQPVQNSPLTDVENRQWARDPLDWFVLSHIEAAGFAPTHDADPRTLVRRLYYDLIGLPPTSDNVGAFIADHQQRGSEAVARWVDRLLASPQFAENWGRYWLDVARYGESNGNDGLGRNPTFPHAWRYRDYVIAAFNEDLPFDRFLTEQIAGDLLSSDSPEQHDRYLVATGFLALGSKPAKAMNTNFDMDVVADQIDLVGRGILGLSVGCARCHDHKFDPIPTRDYYALAGIFTSTETMWGTAANEGLTAPATDLHVLKAAPRVPPPPDFVETVLVLDSNTGEPKKIPKPKWPPGTPLAMGMRDRANPADAKINVKGEVSKLGDVVPRGFPSAIAMTDPPGGEEFEEADRLLPHEPTSSAIPAIDPAQSGRLQLAQWLTRADHPLTARVLVNRLWQQLFGEGIVRTPDDFGIYGERPSDPQLLDHLATRLVHDGWSLKRMIRSIVLSRAYQLASDADPKLREADPLNLRFARHNRRRLAAEALRDSMLHSSGQLDLRPGEGSLVRHRDILVNRAGNLHQPSNQRSVYLCYLRSSPPPELAAFDLPEFTTVTGRRDVSTVPSQALHLYNSPFVIEQAGYLARRVMSETTEPWGRIHAAWRRAFCREPSEQELQQALELVQWTQSKLKSDELVWISLCQALLVSNEFRYVD